MFFPQSIPEMTLLTPLRIGDQRGCFAESYAESSDADHVATEPSAENGHQLFAPVRSAHGFCKLTPGCEVPHKVAAFSDRESDHHLADLPDHFRYTER